MGKCLGVFDSGLGGLTVLKPLLENGCFERCVYFGDTARVPYGTRDADTIRRFALQDARFLLSRGVEELVVACNTITAVALEDIRAQCAVPVCGVIDTAAAAAVAATRNGRIGLLATQATIDNGAYERALDGMGMQLTQTACPQFVTLVEAGARPEDAAVRRACERYLAPVIAAGCDTVILGCTHFPVFEAAIAAALGPAVTLITNGVELAKRIKGERVYEAPQVEFFVSGDPVEFDARRRVFLPGPWPDAQRTADMETY